MKINKIFVEYLINFHLVIKQQILSMRNFVFITCGDNLIYMFITVNRAFNYHKRRIPSDFDIVDERVTRKSNKFFC